MVTRNRLRVGRKQVLPSRNFVDWKTDDPKELKRQLFDFEKHLSVLVEQSAQLLRIINGNETPKRVMPDRDYLEFRGTGVTLTQDQRATIAAIGYEGLDGIDTEQGYIRSSHDRVEFAPAGGSTNHNVNPTGWDTADDLFVTAPSSLATLTGFAAPSSDGTLFRKVIVDPDSPGTQLAIGHLTGSSAGNQVYCPGGSTLTLRRGGSMLLYHPPNELVWFVVATSGVVTSHSALTQLDVPGDHLWALLRDGSRSLQGTWSLGGNTLTNVATLTGSTITATASDGLVFNTTDGHVTIAANGSGRDISLTAADSLFLVATAGGLAQSAATTIVLTAPVIDINAGASGVDVDSTGEINLQTTNGNIVLAAAGSGRDVVVTATDDISLAATDDTFITAGSVLSMGAPDLVVNATNGADVDIGAAGMTIDSTGTLAIATNGANINITAAGGTRDVNVTATGEINLNAPIIDANSNPIVALAYARFINTLLTQSSASGDNDAFSVYGGVPHAVRSSSYNYVIDFPVHEQYGDAAEGSTQSIAINLTSIAGKDLSNGTVDFYSFLSFQQSGTGDDAYQERCHYSYYRAKSTGSATITSGSDAWGDRQRNWNFGSYSHPNTLTISGTNDEIVTFQITLPGASGTGRLLWVIRATGHGG